MSISVATPATTALGRWSQWLLGVRVLDYETYVGMMLNVGRARARQAWSYADGYRLATTKGNIDVSWYDAIAESTEEAEELAFQDNAARQDTRDLENAKRMTGFNDG